MSFKIESGIPCPVPQGGVRKYPFNEMNVGDSFLVNGNAANAANAANAVRIASEAYGRALNRNQKFTVRKTSEGYRCWRIK